MPSLFRERKCVFYFFVRSQAKQKNEKESVCTFLATGSSDLRTSGRTTLSGSSSLTCSDFSCFLFRPFFAIVVLKPEMTDKRGLVDVETKLKRSSNRNGIGNIY